MRNDALYKPTCACHNWHIAGRAVIWKSKCRMDLLAADRGVA